MSLEQTIEPEFVKKRNRISEWYNSRTWWDWLCWIPKNKTKHNEEFKEGEEVQGNLKPKHYGPVRRGLGILGRAATAATLYASLGIAYILAAQADPRTTHNLTDWAAPVFTNAQREGARVMDWFDALVEFRPPEHAALTKRFNDNGIRGIALSHEAPLAYVLEADRILPKSANRIQHYTAMHEHYTLEDLERFAESNTTILSYKLGELAENNVPMDVILDPTLLGFSASDKTTGQEYANLLIRHNLDDIRRLQKLIKEPTEYDIGLVASMLPVMRNNMHTIDDYERFEYDLQTIHKIHFDYTPAEQQQLLDMKPNENIIRALSNGISDFNDQNKMQLLADPVIQEAAEGPDPLRAVTYLALYAEVNGIDNLPDMLDHVRNPEKDGWAYYLNRTDVIFTPERLEKLGLERPPRNLDIFNWYSFTDIAKLIDNDVDMQFALQYKQANRNATADGCIKAYENQ